MGPLDAYRGATPWVGQRFRLPPNWHIYWQNPGDSGHRPSIAWEMPGGVSAGDIRWPTPERLPVGPLTNFGHTGEVTLAVPISVPAADAAGELPLLARALAGRRGRVHSRIGDARAHAAGVGRRPPRPGAGFRPRRNTGALAGGRSARRLAAVGGATRQRRQPAPRDAVGRRHRRGELFSLRRRPDGCGSGADAAAAGPGAGARAARGRRAGRALDPPCGRAGRAGCGSRHRAPPVLRRRPAAGRRGDGQLFAGPRCRAGARRG
ncbi:MAG: hypothetical protein J5X21_16305 [Candidatus Accumulibacter sp.]|nr:hypothetical protein [Candidatus Accumulibacter conexus]